MAISHYFFFIIFSSFLASDPKVKIFIAEFFTIIFEAKSKKENDQILKSINQEAEIIKIVNQIKTDGVTKEQLKIFGQKFPLAMPYIDNKQSVSNKPK